MSYKGDHYKGQLIIGAILFGLAIIIAGIKALLEWLHII